MFELLAFLDKYFSDVRRYAGAMSLLVSLTFTCGWVGSIALHNHFEPVYFVYGAATIPLTLLSAWLLLINPKTKPPVNNDTLV